MKIGVVADIHIVEGSVELPEQVINGLKGCDLILAAGDLTTLPVLRRLQKIAQVTAVAGNMDLPELAKELKRKEIVTCGKYRIGLSHGQGHPDRLVEFLQKEFQTDEVDVIVFGHSHRPMNEYVGKILFFNPGSPTDKFFAPYNSYGILEINDKITAEIKRIS